MSFTIWCGNDFVACTHASTSLGNIGGRGLCGRGSQVTPNAITAKVRANNFLTFARKIQ